MPSTFVSAALLVPLLCALAAPLPARAESPRIVALGDSLTSGRGIDKKSAFPSVLEERLRAAGFDYDVVNAGVSGDTTARDDPERRLVGAPEVCPVARRPAPNEALRA